ncbi:MAG: SpoIID/LytB domain-containing protein [Microgenomates group bacterium]|nr:SpoIID/LytB domain-containing protein [Microgenomates group bacterium]
MKTKKAFLAGTVILFLLIIKTVFADELDEINQNLQKLKEDLKDKEANYQEMSLRLQQIKQRVAFLEKEIIKKEKEVKKGESALLYQKNLLTERTKSYYKNINKNPLSLINFFLSENLTDSLQNFFYQKSVVDEDKKTIIKIVLYIKDLEEKKANLEAEKTKLAAIKIQVDQQAQILANEISQTRKRIAELTARQQQLIAQKLASLNISRSAASLGKCDSDLINGRDPGFSPRFAFFTFGVPNRVGMNQYGAYGRARAGQNEEQILRAYYDNFELKKDYDTGININVNGYGAFNIEDYVKRIYEVPDSWGVDGFAALKAQAIAARSYALAYTNNGQNSICATEQCQVFHSEPTGGFWEKAVDETRGWVMVQGGSPIKAWYSSTHGGYILKSGEIGWSDTSWTKHANDFDGSVSSFSELQNRAYDRDSPWFYCDWGWRPEYNKTAWLKPNEVADIVNTILLARADSSVREHLYQIDRSNPSGTETWDSEKVKNELRSRGITPFNSINEINMTVDFSWGKTTSVNIVGDAGQTSFDAAEFKNWFNLRAPANIQIVGPLYNAEKR